MELSQLGYFVEVVRLGTYAKAAEKLTMSQPALWKRVNNLERELGVALFEREGRRVRPTTAGRRLAEQAEGVIAASERMRAEAAAIAQGARGLVRLVCAPPHLERLASGIAHFRSERPEVDLKIIEAGEIHAGRLLGSGTADVVTASAGSAKTASFPLYVASVVAILPPNQDADPPTHLTVNQLRDAPLLVTPAGYYSRTELEKACQRAGFEPTILIESANASALAALADEGVGIAIVADDALSISRRSHAVVLTDERPIRREVRCYWKDGYPPAELLASAIRMTVDSTSR